MGKISDIINSKPIENLTGFFSEIVGKPLVDAAGILYGDAIKAKRISNGLKLEEMYNLRKSDDIIPTSLSFGYKLLEKATLEDNDELLNKWANLLSNATDKKFSGSIRKIFVEILESLEPVDVKLFDEINKYCLTTTNKYQTMVSLKNIDFSKKETLDVLLSLGLITFGVTSSTGVSISGNYPSTFHGLNKFNVTEMGQSFYKAVNR